MGRTGIRVNVYLDRGNDAYLTQEAKRRRVSKSELVRLLIRALRERRVRAPKGAV